MKEAVLPPFFMFCYFMKKLSSTTSYGNVWIKTQSTSTANFSHPKKILAPLEVTLSGIVISDNSVQYENA